MQQLIRRTALSLAITSAATLAVLNTAQAASSAQAVSRAFDVAPGSLDQALTRFAEQAGLRLMVASELLEGRRSPGLRGQFSAAEGVERLLVASGLKASFSGDMLLIERQPAASGALELGTTLIQSQGLGEMTENTGSYTTGAVSVGGKSPQALRDVAQTVSVISRQRIEDQGLHNVGQVLGQATGITVVGGNDNDMSIYSRGFKITNVISDGGPPNMRDESYQSLPDTIQYDHVEILRGADGLNSGTGEPGGTINLVRKRALDHAQVKLASSAGSWNNYRQEVDVTGPLGFDGKLRGRFAAAAEDREYFYDSADSQKQAYFGVLEADLGADTQLSLGGSYERRDMDGYWDNGLVRSITGDDLKFSRSTSLAADWSAGNSEAIEGFVKLEQNLGEHWRADASYTYSKYDTHHDLGQVGLNATDGSYYFKRTLREFQNEQNLFALNLHGTFEAFGREHELLVGADHANIHKYYADYSRNTPQTPVDIHNTDIGAMPKPVKPTLYYEYPEWDTKKNGGYVTLKARLADPLKLIVGARYNDYEDTQVSVVPDFGSRFDLGGKTSGVVTPYGGLIYDLDDSWSLYTSYAEIFKPQTNYLSFGEQQLAPIEGKTYEFGVKGALYGGRLNVSSAVYYTKRENEAVLVAYSASGSNNCCYAAGGVVVSRGWDTEISGELAPGLQMSAGYTFNINQQRKAGNPDNNGLPLSSQTPKHLFKFFTAYQLPGEFERWKVGMGANIQSRNSVSGNVRLRLSDGSLSPSTTPFAYVQPGYAVWNALVEYRIDEHWTAALNGYNLFDKTYYGTIGSTDRGNWYGEPRNYMLTLRGTF